tara:strand:- start:144 stop:254 length:111 start_codon:yes stop_codon:yes gene_type:complete
MILIFITKIKENKIFEKKSRKIKVLKDFKIRVIISL